VSARSGSASRSRPTTPAAPRPALAPRGRAPSETVGPQTTAPPDSPGTADTRSEILRVALSEFSRRGYYATSLRTIAARVGISKAAVLYHFPEKAELLAALASPMLDDMAAVITAAEQQPDPQARWTILEGLLDVELKHRQLLRTSLRDLALSAAQPVFVRFRDAMLRANALVAGRGASFATRVRAAQALAMLGDPVVLFADAPEDALRSEILRGVHALFGQPTTPPLLAATPSEPRRRGRPSALTPDALDHARRLAASGHPVDQIAATLGVSRATLYRRLHQTISRQL
jgi:AcrR family transcriptional regulator